MATKPGFPITLNCGAQGQELWQASKFKQHSNILSNIGLYVNYINGKPYEQICLFIHVLVFGSSGAVCWTPGQAKLFATAD